MLLIKNCKVLVGNDFLERNILVGDDGRIESAAAGGKGRLDLFDMPCIKQHNKLYKAAISPIFF